jgi:putative membrane-bound dehydrogenase-like protein
MKNLHLLSTLVLLLIWTSTDHVFAADGSSLQAGAAAVEISPQTLPAIMNGGFLQKHANRVLDPLHARALVLSDGQTEIAIVVVDSCMVPTKLCDEIKQLATRQSGIPADHIVISATHTHAAPSVMEMCLGTGVDEAYLKFVPSRVARAITDAHERLQPAKLGWAIVDATELTNCRRWITRSDRMGTDPFGAQTVRAMMHPGYQNPNYASPAGPIDPWLSVLSVVSAEDDSPLCVMANLSMHYFGGGGFSADYFGEVARLLEARIPEISGKASPAFVGVMSQGTSGDLHWMDYSKPRRGIRRQQYSESVADRIVQAWRSIEHRPNLPLAIAEKRLTIDRRTPSRGRREWARSINSRRGDLPPRNREEVYAQQAEWLHENPQAEVVLQAIRIGELGITAIPNEVYGITGLKLKRQSPLTATFNLELANGATGYIPPPEQHRLGGYTTWPARTAGLVEQAEPLIVDTLLSLLETVSGKKRRSIVHPDSAYSKQIKSKKPIAYWRLDDMVAGQAKDAVGGNEASYRGAVALFLPESIRSTTPPADFGNPAAYGNRCVYLAGGHLAANLPQPLNQYSLVMRFWNALPTHVRDTTGVLLDNGSETLQIAGKAAGQDAGKLTLKAAGMSWTGKTSLALQHWHQVAVTRENKRIRVYLDGNEQPEIDAAITSPNSAEQWLIGSDKHSAAPFDGKIDEVAVLDRALAGAEIAALYATSGLTAPPQPQPTIVLGAKPSDPASRNRYADAVLASEPVAFWRLHDQSSQFAADSAGEHTAKYEPGARPLQQNVAQPNFSGGRVKAHVPKLGKTYSVELWFRNELPVDSRPVTAYVFSRAVDGVDGADGDNLGIGGTHAHSGQLIVFNGNGRGQLVAGRTHLAPGSWSHVVMVRQDNRITVYLNGNPKPEIAAKLPIGYPEPCGDLLLGGRADHFANLQGMLEEVAVYNRALTPQEAKAHFDAAAVEQVERAANSRPTEPTPTDADKALETIHIRDGFKVELVAAEPLVKDPVAIDWGPDGKLWVVEMADYPLGIDGKGTPGGRVRFLEDTDDDGRFDKSTLFADELSFPTGILVWGQGVLVTAAPQIVYLEDRSGDGKSDVRRVLYSGFLEGNQQLRVNGLRWGLDNWIHCASGSHHGGYGKDSQITSHLSGTKHQIGSRDFRIRPATGAIDPQSGPSQFGRNRDDWGEWFGVQNSHPLWHYVLADHHIRRNPHFAPPDPKHQLITASNPPVYPVSKLQKRYHNFNQAGRFTSACSAMIYRDDYLFDRGTEQHAFTCEPFHNLVQHNLITDEGVSFKSRRDPAEAERTDFFASDDRWCRPVMARTGPDGALWVVDMYRYMIEHPQWLPPQGKNELRPWYRSGDDRGRIYRVVRSEQPPREISRLVDRSPRELVAALESPNGWQRDTAQRLLVEGPLGPDSSLLPTKDSTDATAQTAPNPRVRLDQATLNDLRAMAINSKQPLARLHALCTLDGLDALPPETLQAALKDGHAGVRRNAVRIAARHKVGPEHLDPLVNDPDPKVRLELATTLGAYDDPAASAALARLAIRSSESPYLMAAIISSLNPRNVSEVLAAAIRSPKVASADVTAELIGQAVAMGEKETLDRAIETVSASKNELTTTQEFESLTQILDALSIRKWSAEELSQSARDRIAQTTEQARRVAADHEAAADTRAAAIPLLGRSKSQQRQDFQLMKRLLHPTSPVVVQRAVVETLTRFNEPAVAEILLANWRSHSPQLRSQILGELASRPSWAEALRGRLEAGTIRASELNAPIRQQLLSISNDSSQWQKLFAGQASTNRGQVLRRFKGALKRKGDGERGAVVFRKTCINCHKYKDEGHEVGPQLASITSKTKEALLTAILDPNAAVDAKYFNYSVITHDGRTFSGKLETETGSSITLLAAGGKRTTILRRDIERLSASNKSLMPEGIETELDPQDLADLIQFVREAFR